MSSLYRMFETSPTLIGQGAPYRLPKNDDGTTPTFHIARAHSSNQLFAKVVAEVYTPEINERVSEMTEEEARDLELEVFVRANLIGWENVLTREGEPLKFSAANAKALFADLPELFDLCRQFSYRLSNYLKTAEEKAVKN